MMIDGWVHDFPFYRELREGWSSHPIPRPAHDPTSYGSLGGALMCLKGIDGQSTLLTIRAQKGPHTFI